MTDKEIFDDIMAWAYSRGGDFKKLHSLYYTQSDVTEKKRIAVLLLKAKIVLEPGYFYHLSPELTLKMGLNGMPEKIAPGVKNLIETLNRDKKRVSCVGEIEL